MRHTCPYAADTLSADLSPQHSQYLYVSIQCRCGWHCRGAALTLSWLWCRFAGVAGVAQSCLPEAQHDKTIGRAAPHHWTFVTLCVTWMVVLLVSREGQRQGHKREDFERPQFVTLSSMLIHTRPTQLCRRYHVCCIASQRLRSSSSSSSCRWRRHVSRFGRYVRRTCMCTLISHRDTHCTLCSLMMRRCALCSLSTILDSEQHSSRIRFLRFFENPKNATFYVFLKWHFKKT